MFVGSISVDRQLVADAEFGDLQRLNRTNGPRFEKSVVKRREDGAMGGFIVESSLPV